MPGLEEMGPQQTQAETDHTGISCLLWLLAPMLRRHQVYDRTPALKTLFLEISVFSFISVPGTCLSSTGHLEQPVVSAGPPVHSLAALHSSSTFITPKPPANKAGRAPAGNQPFLWWKTTKGDARPPPAPQHPGNVPAQRPHEGLCQNRFLWDTP